MDIKRENFTTTDFRLENGAVLPEATLACETYGKRAPDGGNAVLLTHGYTSSQHMAGRSATGAEGSWDGLVGPGKAIDTDRFYVVASNMLGSSYGSTGPASINPATGQPYGPDFPDISLVDIVTLQRALLAHLGIAHLVAVAGPSYGGFQAFQWGVTFPDFVEGIVAAVTAPKGPGDLTLLDELVRRLAQDENWHGGRYYDRGGMVATLTEMRIETLKNYGIEEQLASTFPDAAERAAEIRRTAAAWAGEFDANALVVLRRAHLRFDAEKDFAKLRAKVLYVLSRTDRLFPPSLAPGVMARLRSAGVRPEYFEIDSDLGHAASGLDAAKWAPRLKQFMSTLRVGS
jgi:homoserine O-acetyltransferase